MSTESHLARREALKRALRPIVSFCVRRSLMLQDLVDLLKPLFVEECHRYLQTEGSKVNVNRISIATGVHRKDVRLILKEGDAPIRTPSLLWRVLGQWSVDQRYTTSSGKPRVLPFESGSPNFCELCFSVSRFLHPKTVRAELLRKGAVEDSQRGLRLLVAEEKVGDAIERRWDLLQSFVEDALVAVEQNSEPGFSPRNLFGRTEFDNIDPRQATKIRAWIMREGKRFHRRLRRFLAGFDYDFTRALTRKGEVPIRVSIATVSVATESHAKSFDAQTEKSS